MELKRFDYDLTICKLESKDNINLDKDFYFIR